MINDSQTLFRGTLKTETVPLKKIVSGAVSAVFSEPQVLFLKENKKGKKNVIISILFCVIKENQIEEWRTEMEHVSIPKGGSIDRKSGK